MPSEEPEENQQPRRKLICSRTGCLVVVIIISIVLWFGIFSHDWNLLLLRRNYAKLKHPSGTHIIAENSKLGLLIANSNHIDYFVGELRSYTGSRSDIRRFYKTKTVWNPIAHQQQNVELQFVDELNVDEYTDLSVPDPIIDIINKFSGKHAPGNRNKLYVIYVFDPGYPCGLDIRGV